MVNLVTRLSIFTLEALNTNCTGYWAILYHDNTGGGGGAASF